MKQLASSSTTRSAPTPSAPPSLSSFRQVALRFRPLRIDPSAMRLAETTKQITLALSSPAFELVTSSSALSESSQPFRSERLGAAQKVEGGRRAAPR